MSALETQRQAGAGRRKPKRFAFPKTLRLGSGTAELERALLHFYRELGVEVLAELWEEDVERLCGRRWKRRSDAKVRRAGWCDARVVLAGESQALRRPRVRAEGGRELELPSFKAAAKRDLLSRDAIEDITASITTGTFPRGRHSRDVIGRGFVERLATRAASAHATPRRAFPPGLLLASLDFEDQAFVGGVSVDRHGKRRLAAISAGSLDNESSVDALLEELIWLHRRATPPEVFLVGEEAAAHQAVRKRFGASTMFHRLEHDKRRRVLGLLPAAAQPEVLERLLEAYSRSDATAARRALRQVHASLEREYPEAAEALADGLEDTLTLMRLGQVEAPRGKRVRDASADT